MFAKFLVFAFVVAFVHADDQEALDPAHLGASILRVVNNAAADIIDTDVYRTRDVEWGPFNAPQYNFQRLNIQSGSSLEKPEDVNLNSAASNFHMRLTFSDGTFDDYQMNQQYVFDKAPNFEKLFGSRLIKYGKAENNTLEIVIVDGQ